MTYILTRLDRYLLILQRYRHFRYLPVTATGLILFLSLALPVQAQVTGISYTLSPVGNRIYFSDNAGLDNGFLYGAELGFGFGEFLEVDGVYLFGNDFSTDFTQFSNDILDDEVELTEAALEAFAGLPSREVKLRRYGGKLRLNLGRSHIIPFVSAGTGILRIAPENLEASEHIYADLGVGLTFSIADRYTLSVAAQNLTYRYDPASTFLTDAELQAVGLSFASFSPTTVNNPTVSASLTFILGGRSGDDLTDIDRALLSQFRGGNFRLAVEPFYGQINFNSALGFPDSRALTGINAGFDFGPYIGLRAFYWRDTKEEKMFEDGLPTTLGDLSFYGGEMNLRFSTQFGGRSLTPYLIFGGGYMDIDAGSNFLNAEGVAPESRYFAIGGGGIELPMTSSIKVQGGVRGLFMSTQAIEDVSQPSNVFGSLMYTAGINFNIGGSGRTLGATLEGQRAADRAEDRDRAEAMEVELARIQARLDSLETARMAMPAVTRTSTVQPALVMQRDTVMVPVQRMSNFSGHTLTIPVPEEGEIYVRFGSAPAIMPVETTYAPPTIVSLAPTQMVPMQGMMPSAMRSSAMIPIQTDSSSVGGLSIAQIQQIVRQAIAEQQMQAPQSSLTSEQLEESLQSMENRIERRIAQESNRLRGDLQEQPRQMVAVQGGEPVTETTEQQPSGLLRIFQQRDLVGVLPFAGVRLGEGKDQFLVGVRADYRFSGQSYRFLPEFALAFSDKVGLSALANVAWSPFDLSESMRPYVGPGVGFVSDSGLSGLDLAFNLFAGLEYTTVGGATFFGEFSTLDLFDFNRVLVGYRFRF